jgi:hypothetical protein
MGYYMMVKRYVLTYRTDDPDKDPTTVTFTSYKKAMTYAKELAKDEKVIDILIGLPSKV